MGVRFECPVGHKLHVKAHLAGQRGICPECGMRFIVPTFSGGRVAEAPGAEAGANAGSVSVAVESATSFDRGLSDAAGLEDDDGDESILWYVRPVEGGQFGPADSTAFAKWIDEGRVSVDSWVWRTGWADWKPGADALKAFASPGPRTPLPAGPPPRPASRAAAKAKAAVTPTPTLTPIPTAASSYEAELDAVTGALRNGQSAAPLGVAVQQPVINSRAEQLRRRKQLNQWLTVGLAVLAMLLLGVLIAVLNRPAPTPVVEEAPASPTTAGEPFADAPATP